MTDTTRPAGGHELTEALARAYYEPLGWDMDDLDPDDLRECMRAMEPVAAEVERRILAARGADAAVTDGSWVCGVCGEGGPAHQEHGVRRDCVYEPVWKPAAVTDDGLRAAQAHALREAADDYYFGGEGGDWLRHRAAALVALPPTACCCEGYPPEVGGAIHRAECPVHGSTALDAAVTDDREALGRLVREVWVEWAHEQPDPKPSWLVGWNDLDERDREVDRRIGERLAARGAAVTDDGLRAAVEGATGSMRSAVEVGPDCYTEDGWHALCERTLAWLDAAPALTVNRADDSPQLPK